MGSTEAETLGGRVQQEAASSSEGALTMTTKRSKRPSNQQPKRHQNKKKKLAPSNIKRASNDQCSKQTWNSFTDL
jgi:hypothetical protein